MIRKITQKFTIKAEEDLDDDKGPTILKSEVVKAIKDMQKRPQKMTTYQWSY